MKALYVAPVEPWSRENGSSLITADLLDELASIKRLELLAVFVRRPPAGYERVPASGLEGILLDIEGLPRWHSVLKAGLLGSSPLRHRFDNRLVATAIRKKLDQQEFRPDVVHVEHLPLVDIGLEIGRLIKSPVVYRAHNVESRLWARRLSRLPSPLRAPLVAYMERREALAVNSVDLTLCISEGDLRWAREHAPTARSELLPCTLRLDRYDSVPRREPFFGAQICFAGGLDWAPNEDGLRWFIERVLPRIARTLPHAGLAVLARGAETRPWLRDNRFVHILPPEESAAELFASSHVSIAPLFQGGGVRIKIPESLAVECPVVATTVGAEGHELPGVTRTDDPERFAVACLAHLERKGRDRSGSTLRSGVEARYGASGQAGRLVSLWSESVEAFGARRRAPTS